MAVFCSLCVWGLFSIVFIVRLIISVHDEGVGIAGTGCVKIALLSVF